MFCTNVDSAPFETRPMGTAKVDEQGYFWFLSPKESHKNKEIGTVDHVHLIYSDPSSAQFMNVCGHATVSQDKEKIYELWNDLDKAWFTEGKDDPDRKKRSAHRECLPRNMEPVSQPLAGLFRNTARKHPRHCGVLHLPSQTSTST